jgi:hypothetical protein
VTKLVESLISAGVGVVASLLVTYLQHRLTQRLKRHTPPSIEIVPPPPKDEP